MKGKKTKPIRSLSEWAWDVPVSHMILASEAPKKCQSIVWAQQIGITADFAAGRDRLLAFIDVVGKAKPKNPKAFAAAVEATKKVMKSKKYVGKLTQLEAGEIFDMSGHPLGVAHKNLLKDLATTRKKVEAAIAGKEAKWVKHLAKEWETELGLEWSDVLYFDPGG